MLPLLRETPPSATPTVIDEASVAEARPASGLPDEDPFSLDLWIRLIGVGAAMGFFLSFVGALGTSQAPFFKRLFYWETVVVLGSILAFGVNCGIRIYVMPKAPMLLREIATAIAATLVITAFVFAVTPLFWNNSWNSRGLWGLTSAVFVITLIMTFLHYALDRKPQQSRAFAPAAQATETPLKAAAPEIVFYERLPLKFRGQAIRALSSEDHYLRVHTPIGDTLILMRLYDAIRELEGIEGSQTHRSWWVARSAILEVLRRDGRVSLRLEGGLQVPVSRSFQKALKDEGWL